MEASKHIIYLTKNHSLPIVERTNSNIFMFNENGPAVQAKWLKKTIEQFNGCFVIMDHNNAILHETSKILMKKNYFIEEMDLSGTDDGIRINPFHLVTNTSEIHFMFLNILYAIWDNQDPDIAAMSNLIDAFASCVFFMFNNNKEKLNMQVLRKMVYSVRATLNSERGPVLMSDAIFDGIKDQESMPCKYYAQFKKAAGERQAEIAEKVAQVFDRFTEADMLMMSETDNYLTEELNSKTALFLNVNRPEDEHTAKLAFILLNYFVQHVQSHQHALFVVDKLNDTDHMLISLPYWMKEANEHDMSFVVISNDLSCFMANPRAEKYFRSIQKDSAAYVIVNQNSTAQKYASELPITDEEMMEFTNQEIVAIVQIPGLDISEKDLLF